MVFNGLRGGSIVVAACFASWSADEIGDEIDLKQAVAIHFEIMWRAKFTSPSGNFSIRTIVPPFRLRVRRRCLPLILPLVVVALHPAHQL